MENYTYTEKVCKEPDCGSPFSISTDEAAWLKERNLALFERCGACRRKRRLARTADASVYPLQNKEEKENE